MTAAYPDSFVKAGHYPGCTGDLYRGDIVHIDRTGRVGNGSIIAHEYICNRRWAKCRARVIITERAVRRLAVVALSSSVADRIEPNTSGAGT